MSLIGPDAVELFATLQRADELIAGLRAVAPPAAARPAVDTVSIPPLVLDPPGAARGRHWSVPVVLLSLGALCLVVGALVFLAVTWSVLGVGGRTAVLVALTVVAGAGTVLSARRGLRAAAETFAAVAALFLALDLAGAANAGWFGDLGASGSVLLGAVVVVVVPALGNAVVARLPTGPLVTPQLVATGASLVAVAAALNRFGDHPLLTMSVSIVVAVAVAVWSHRVGQRVLAVGEAVTAILVWLLVVVTGLGQSIEALVSDGAGAATWSDVEPLLVAAAFAAAFVAIGRLVEVSVVSEGVATVATCWLVPPAVAAVVAESMTVLVLVGVVATLVVVGSAVLLRPLARALGVAATGLAAAALLGALTAVQVLVDGVAAEVSRQLSSSSPDLGARADLAPFDATVAAPWTLPLAALALATALTVAVTRTVRSTVPDWRPAFALAAPVVAAMLLCYLPFLLLVVVFALVLAAQHLPARLRPWSQEAGVVIAICWTGVGAVVSVYDPGAATAVALATTAVVATYVVRSGSVLAQAALPPLVATSVVTGGWLLDAPGAWTVAAVIVAVAVVTVALASHPAMHLAALATCLVVVPFGVDAAATDQPTWLAAYLTLIAAAAAVVAIKDRSLLAAWTGALLELGATWVRLGASGVSTPEAYTLPLAAVLLAFGGWAWWHDRSRGTVRTLGPGIVAALLPSLVVTLDDPVSLRALLLAAACGVLLVIGAAARLQAPLLCGALFGAALVVVELFPYHDAVPRWVLLTVAGVCLVVAGVRWEYLATLGRRSWGRLQELG